MAQAVIFLSKNHYVNGEIIAIDGGVLNQVGVRKGAGAFKVDRPTILQFLVSYIERADILNVIPRPGF